MALQDDTLRSMQDRVANACVGASALRGSKEGTIAAVRAFFRSLVLDKFSALSSELFEQQHAETIAGLHDALRKKRLSAKYGRCAKAVNLFLRDATCHHHLREHYKLAAIEPLLHLPVDEKVAYELRNLDGSLPRWTGVKKLKKEKYQKYQNRAQQIANERQICRVFLDDEFWSRPKSDRAKR
jgi:hypothetical protein